MHNYQKATTTNGAIRLLLTLPRTACEIQLHLLGAHWNVHGGQHFLTLHAADGDPFVCTSNL